MLRLYPYTADPGTLSACHLPRVWPAERVRTPLVEEAWMSALSMHLDRAFARYITEGIKKGFMIGFHQTQSTQPAACNMLSEQDTLRKYICTWTKNIL